MRGLVLTVLLFSSLAYADRRLCGPIIFKEGWISVGANEKILLCGSSESKDAWKKIPVAQAQLQLKNLLQRKGYQDPKFEERGDELWVWAGEQRIVKDIEIRPRLKELDPNRLRQVLGYPLTSDVLDDVTNWAELELKSQGYACARVKVTAELWNNRIVVTADPGARSRVRSIHWEGHDNLQESVLRRFAAMKEGQLYDVQKSQLTTSRLFNEGLFDSVHIQPKCAGENTDIEVRTSVGRPKLLRFGFGASTEEYVFTDVSFRNSRLDNRASAFSTKLHVSPLQQNLEVGSELYMFPLLDTAFLGPRFTVGRTSESRYEVNQSKAGIDIGQYGDWLNARYLVKGGPTLNYVDTVRGIGPKQTTYLDWQGALSTHSHLYESRLREQDAGWSGFGHYRGQRDRVGSTINVDRFEAGIKYLWNMGSYTPPLFVLALRAQGIAVNVSDDDFSLRRDQLPVDYRLYWGGDQNLRGFSRQSLHFSKLGYLTGLYGGTELRLVEVLPYRLQPFGLFDWGRLGRKRWTLDEDEFISWGGGIRWMSPIGNFRVYAAKGEILGETASSLSYQQEWVYFLGFGQEF
ncbi:MAG: POTRA domain-containing protein [Bdellovibrionales bacterium]